MNQTLIALDQLINTLISDDGDSGWADETISSRAWRLADTSRSWRAAQRWIDRVFLLLFRQSDHCFEAYISERLRQQLPPEMRMPPP